MTVLFVTPFFFPELKFGGPPKRLHAMARALKQAGVEVEAVTTDSEQRARYDSTTYDDVLVQYLPWSGKALYAFPMRRAALADAIRRADVVHCFGLYNFICPVAARFACRYRKPFVLEPMGMYAPRLRSVAAKRIYNVTFTRWMAKHSSAIVATSEVERAELQPLAALAEIVVRSNGIDVQEFASLPPASIMRERWGIRSEDKVILYLGRISEKKQLRQLVTAFDQADVPQSKLVIAGPVSEPSYADRLKSDIATNARKADIRFEGPLYDADLKAALSSADLFVMPSLNENFGNAAAEAVAAGVPVLLTDTCGIAPMIHGRAGMAVKLGIEPLAEGLRQMLDPVIRDQFLVHREDVKRELSWDEPIAQTIALYERIVAQSKK